MVSFRDPAPTMAAHESFSEKTRPWVITPISRLGIRLEVKERSEKGMNAAGVSISRPRGGVNLPA